MHRAKRQLTVPEAAKMLGVTFQTIHRRISTGRIRGAKVGGVYVVQAADLAKFHRLKSGRRKGVRSI